MKKTFFSVVMPIYNKEKTLARSVASVLHQRYGCFELILVCDPSNDKSTQIAFSFSDPRVKVFVRSEAGPGGYAARNLGVEKSEGEYVAFIDADDIWDESHLLRSADAIRLFPSESVFSSSWSINERGVIRRCLFHDTLGGEISGPHKRVSLYEYLVREQGGARAIFTSSLVVKRDLISSVGFPEGLVESGGDANTWLILMFRAQSLIFLLDGRVVYDEDAPNKVSKTSLSDPFLAHVTAISLFINCAKKQEISILKRRCNGLVVYALRRNAQLLGVFQPELMKFYFLSKISPGDALRVIFCYLSVAMRGAIRKYYKRAKFE